MATSKSQAKAKLKKRIGRFAKMELGNKESGKADASDLSQLRKPIDINLSSLKQVAQLYEKGSAEVRDILTYECDVIYECRICRSLFRSLANLISHKRIYCREKYSVRSRQYSVDPTDSAYYKNNNSDEKTFVDFDHKEKCSNDRILRSQATRKEPKIDLTSVVDMLTRKQNNDSQCDNIYDGTQSTCPLHISNDNEQVLLEMIDSNQAAYQTILSPQSSVSSHCDLITTQTVELKNMPNRNTAVLGPDGQVHEIYSNVPRYSSQDENDDLDTNVPNFISTEDLTCTTCNTKFATKKTLTFHVKCKHTPHRMDFICPCCSSTFTNRWSVYRHLFKVHRKSNEQVRRLRSQIQGTALRRDTSRLEKITKSRETAHQQITEETQNLIIAQEWMENLELDAELQRCGVCGKRFDRKAALMSHSQICKKRVAVGARNESTGRHKRASKIPPQRVSKIIDSSENGSVVSDKTLMSGAAPAKPPSPTMDIQNLKTMDLQQPPAITIIPEPPKEAMEIAIRVEDVSSLSKDVWDMIGIDNFAPDSEPICDKTDSLTTSASEPVPPITTSSQEITKAATASSDTKTSLVIENSDVPEVIYTSIDNSRPVALSVLDKEQKLGIQYRGIRLPTVTLEKINITRNRSDAASIEPVISLNVSATDSEAIQVDKKLSSFTNLRRLQCLPCNRKFLSLLNLQRHIAVHLRRSRYRCKLCDFKAFLKCECVAHCNKKHNARNNRSILSELIIEMTLNNDLPDNDTSDENDDTERRDEFEVIDMTYGIPSTEMCAKQPAESNQDKLDRNKNNISPIDRQVCTMSNDPLAKGKPRRGRPPNSKKGKKTKAVKRNSARKVRHISPPTLNEVLSESDEITNITNSMESNKQCSAKTDERLRLRGPSRMDTDPELRKMVMEVIFGPAEEPINDNADKRSNGIPVEDINIE